MIDHAAAPLRMPARDRLADDVRDRRGLALDRTSQWIAAERAETHAPDLRLLAIRERQTVVIDHDQHAVMRDYRARRREIERNERNSFLMDVEPDVELGPVREWEDAQALALALAGVVEPPGLDPLALGVPAMLRATQREHALLGARALLVAARAPEGGIEAVQVERLAQRLRLHHVGVQLGAMRDRRD